MGSFQGLWTDPVTGISYARARWYDARNASWLSEDPLLDVDSPNLYAFVGWRPNSGIDPLGLYQKDIHFYGTYYLSRLAGFSSEEAFKIAYAAQNVDDDLYADPIYNSTVGNEEIAVAVHFPSHLRQQGGPGPDSGSRELVKENEPAAREAVRAAARSGNLTRLGVAIHAYEDTFAHATFNIEYGGHNRRDDSGWPNIGHADTLDGGHRPDIPNRDIKKAERVIVGALKLLREAFVIAHGEEPPTYTEFEVSIVKSSLRFAIESGALPDRSATTKELGQSLLERVAAWQVITSAQFGEYATYKDEGPSVGFREAVDQHVEEVMSRVGREQEN